MTNSRSKLYIENMLSQRCKKIVQNVLEEFGLESTICELGEVDVKIYITPEQRHRLKIILATYGFKLLDEEKTWLIQRIIVLINERFYRAEQGPKINFSEFLTQNSSYEYNYLATLFSRIKGITLENYIIVFKIEKVKELLLYDDCSLKQISYKLDYSSVAHLSSQFKKVTGITPSKFKCLNTKRLNSTVRITAQSAPQYQMGNVG